MTTLSQRSEEAERELREHVIEMCDQIDGAEESRGHDSMLTRWLTEAGKAADLIAEQREEIRALRTDAERYRWMRSQPMNGDYAMVNLELLYWNEDGPDGTYYSYDGAELDAAIDAAKEQK